MGIQSIRCALPCCARAEEEQAKCSLITRIAIVGLGSIALLVGLLALSGTPGLSALGTTGGGALTAIGSLILLAGFCLRCVKNGTIGQNLQNRVQSNNRTTANHQKFDPRPIFHEGETWLDALVDDTANYTSFKLIMTINIKGNITTKSLVADCIPVDGSTAKDMNLVAKEEFKYEISQVCQMVLNLGQVDTVGIDSSLVVSFTLITKSKGNQFGLHHQVVGTQGVISSFSNSDQSIGVNKDFAQVFATYGLKVEPQLDDSYNFI